jgi:hypothetical protein
MKTKLFRRLSVLFLISFFSLNTYCQHLELTAFGGGTFAAGIDNYSAAYYKAQIGGSFHYGGELDYYVQPHTSVGINVISQATTGYLYGNGLYQNISDPMHMTYILAEGNQFFGKGKIREYGGIGFGAAIITPSGYTSATKFAVDIHGGLKVELADHLALRVQLQLDQPIDGGGYGIGVGTGGTEVAVTGYATILQFGGNLGVTYRF